MIKNYLLRTFLLTAMVVGLLCLAYFLPSSSFFKKIDIFSDLRKQKPDKKEVPEVSEPLSFLKPSQADSCEIYYTCIEDFTLDATAMQHFYSILDSIPVLNRPVRIAFFGDSFIESDIITADIREQLQEVFGGQGVGYMPLTSAVPGYRKSIIHRFQHISTSSIIHTRNGTGIAGYSFKTGQGASVYYQGTGYKKGLDKFSGITLLYEGQPHIFASYSINQGKISSLSPDVSPGLHAIRLKGSDIRSIAFTFSPNMLLHGVFLDGEKGIAVDNFAVRGHSGMNLLNISEETLKRTGELIPYDLIVLQYGLNVAGTHTKNYEAYKKSMLENIRHVREAFPQASMLLMSVGDRNTMQQGHPVTMEGVHHLIPIQQEIAAESGIAFWNTFEAMGGEAGIASFVEAVPPLAAKDYTHLTHEGGKVIASRFVEALLYGKRRYDRQTAKQDYD